MQGVAAQRYDFTGLPSGYCMFELFEAGDTVDETTEDALKWKKEADRLPEKFAEQTNRIWENWEEGKRRAAENLFSVTYLCISGGYQLFQRFAG